MPAFLTRLCVPQYSFQILPRKQCQMTPKGQTTDERRRWRRHLCTRARKENVGVHVLFDPRSLPRVGLPRCWRDTSVLSPASPSACPRIPLWILKNRVSCLIALACPTAPSIPARCSPVSTDTERSALRVFCDCSTKLYRRAALIRAYGVPL